MFNNNSRQNGVTKRSVYYANLKKQKTEGENRYDKCWIGLGFGVVKHTLLLDI
tara:strand:+ start:752 stop:910 length:159 start_codon:yes stop_codon:yes gene_type:complete